MPSIQPASQSPRANPLTYPGIRPDHSSVICEHDEWVIEDANKPIGDRRVVDAPASRVRGLMSALGTDQLQDRVPVIAIGSNSCPAQLRHKAQQQRFPLGIPMVKARVRGLRITHSAFASMLGYIPATVAFDLSHEEEVFVIFLNNHQLMEMDNSEARYRRLMLSSRDGFQIDCSGHMLSSAYVYMSDGGYLSRPDDADRAPIPLTDQSSLFESLMAWSDDLAGLIGGSPEEAVARARAGAQGWCADFETALNEAGWVEGRDQASKMKCHKDKQPVYLGLNESVVRSVNGVVAC